MAQKLRMQGDVRVSFSLDNDGKVSNIKVIGSSGFDILDEDAVSLIEKTASRFPKPSESVRISVPLSYTLH
jgi:protein TonB